MLFAVAATLMFAAVHVAADPVHRPHACWLESSSADTDAALGGQSLRNTPVWQSTLSGVLVRDPQGDVLTDTGYGPSAESQMNELPEEARAFGSRVVAASKNASLSTRC